MGLEPKDKQVKAKKEQQLNLSSLLKFLYKPFAKKKLQKRLLQCAGGHDYEKSQTHGENLWAIDKTKRIPTSTRDEKGQQSGVKNLLPRLLHPNVRSAGGSFRSTETTAAPLNKRKPPLSPHLAVPSSASQTKSAPTAAAVNQKKPPTVPSSSSTKPPPSEITAAAAVEVLTPQKSLLQSASSTPGHSPLSGGTISAAESPETLYTAIHRNSGTTFMRPSQNSVPISVSYANSSPTAYKYSSTPSPSASVTKIKSPVSISSNPGPKFVPSSPDAYSPASYISRDISPSVKSEPLSPTVESDAANGATQNRTERRSPKWTDDAGNFYARPAVDSIFPARPLQTTNKNVLVRRSTGSNLTQISPESRSPSALSRHSPNYMSKLSPECISSSTCNPSESVRAKRQRPSRPNVADIAEGEQPSALSILRSSPLTGTRSNGSNFSPFMQGLSSEPDLSEYTSKPRRIPTYDSKVNINVSKTSWNESGSYRTSPQSTSSHESDEQAHTSGPGDATEVRQVSNLASLWSAEEKQSGSSVADTDATSNRQPDSFFRKNLLPRSRSTSNFAELDADSEAATPQRSPFRYRSFDFDRAKDFLKLAIKKMNSSPLASESSGSRVYEKTGGTRHAERKNLTVEQKKRSLPFSSPNIAKLASDGEISKPKQTLSRSSSLNSNRSESALKISIKDGEVCDNQSTQDETVTHAVRRNSLTSILDLLKPGRQSSAKMEDSREVDYLTDSSAKSPVASTENRAERAYDNPLFVSTLDENTVAGDTGIEIALRSGELAGHQKLNTINSSSVVPGSKAGVFSQNVSIPDCNGHATGLPPDLWQLVFCFLPRHQILGDLRVVCHEWQSAIDNFLFLPHMKQYQILHNAHNNPSLAPSAKKVERWLAEFQLTTVVGLLRHLLSHPFATAPDKLASSLRLQYLATQDKDSAILDCWSNCIATLDGLSREFEGDAWCLALLLILFVCEGPSLQYLLEILLSGKTGACRPEAMEFLYLVLSVMTASCWEDDKQPLLCELESAVGYTEFVDAQKSLQEELFCFTSEQHEILETELLPNQILVIKAFPGTGKTSTLLEYANRRRRSKFAYTIFDRFVVTEGEATFPENTKCINFQKLAYAKVGWQYRHKLHSNNLPPVMVKAALGVSSYATVRFILLTLEQFMQSADLSIKDCHVPKNAIISASRAEVAYYLGKAENLWNMMIDKGSREIPMTHQGYLKLYQLSESLPDNQYDCWLCDEVQNATPVMLDIVLRQKGYRKILAGDPHQQMHGFGDMGGLIERMKGDSAVIHLNLTFSFRFGREIALTCNYFLQLKKEKTALTGVKSTPKKYLTAIGNVHSDLTSTGRERGAVKGQVVFIARSNAKVLEAALQCRKRKLGFIGGFKGYQFDLMRDTWHLMKGNHNQIQDSYIKSLSSYKHMMEVAEQTKDVEVLARVKVVEAHQEDLPRRIEAVQAMDVGVDLTTAEVLFSTAYKAKGLEFDVVALTNDFVEVMERSTFKEIRINRVKISPVKWLGGKLFVDDDRLQEENREVDAQELNLLYVAASRAKSRLLLNNDVDKYLRRQATGLRREPRALLRHVQDSLSCASCQKPCNSCLAIVAGCVSDSEDTSNNNATSAEDSLLEGPPSSLGQILEINQYRTSRCGEVCVCLGCAQQQQTVPDTFANFSGAVKTIASVFTYSRPS